MLMWQSFGFLYKKKDHLNIFRNKPNLDVGFLSQLAFHPQLTEPYGQLTEPYGIHAISSFGFLSEKKDHLNIFRNTPNLDVGFLSQLAFHPQLTESYGQLTEPYGIHAFFLKSCLSLRNLTDSLRNLTDSLRNLTESMRFRLLDFYLRKRIT